MHSAQSTPDTKPDVPGCQTGSITVASCWCYSLLVHGLRSIILLWGILLLLSISLLLISLLRDTLCGVLLLRVPCSCRRCGQVNQNSDRCRTTDRFEYTTYLEEDNLTCCPRYVFPCRMSQRSYRELFLVSGIQVPAEVIGVCSFDYECNWAGSRLCQQGS